MLSLAILIKSSKIEIHKKIAGDIIRLTVGKDIYDFDKPIRLETLSKKYDGVFYAALVNNRLRELAYKISYDAQIEFLDYSFYDSTRIYATSMRFLVCMAFDRLYKNVQIKFSNSISMGIYGRTLNKTITEEILNEVEQEMKKIIEEDIPIRRTKISIKEASEYYKSQGYFDKVETLKYRKEIVNIYKCGDYENYMYGYMVPSTGYLREYEIHFMDPGFLIQYPRREEKGEIPEFVDSPKFFDVLNRAEEWAVALNVDMIYKMNKIVEKGNEKELVDKCEKRHLDQLEELSDDIISRKDVRLVAIAGPSSSGKTTFAKRLELTLESKGKKPLMISIDNYYLPPEMAPIDEFGEPDLEHIESLDIKLFNENMLDLINGKPTELPIFDFKTKLRHYLPAVTISEDTIIIIEGIHALNNRLTEFIPREKKYKVYISPFTQVNIDINNPIHLTDLRLLRRIVRDLQFRNTSAEQTLQMWPSVRRGEYRWIYPHIENSDYIYNSELTYEFSVLKKYSEAALRQIDSDSKYFVQANRLLKFVKYFSDISPDLVPDNSLLREFIGGSIFEH